VSPKARSQRFEPPVIPPKPLELQLSLSLSAETLRFVASSSSLSSLIGLNCDYG
jgi:hypothetical protein